MQIEKEHFTAADFARLRKDTGLTQRVLADRLDRSVGWVRDLEQGREPVPAYAIYAMRYLADHPTT